MKFYYGNSVREAIANEPVEIMTVATLREYEDNYSVVMPVDEDEELNEENLLVGYFVFFDNEHKDLDADFDDRDEAFDYAKENVKNIPEVFKCWQSDLDEDLGDGDDYDEQEITDEDVDLSEMLKELKDK